MLYLIDSGNAQEIEEALMLGARGVTANTSMYRKNDICMILLTAIQTGSLIS